VTLNPPLTPFNPVLHGVRGLAALSVLLFHWEQFFPAAGVWVQQFFPADSLIDPTVYIGFGWMGVPVFFILSGWLLGAQVINARLSPSYLGRFWTRRLFRIYPAVWAELLILLLLAEVIPGLITQASYDTLHLQFLLWLNLPPVMAVPLNGVWWTLPVELGFYLALPLLGWLAGFMSWRALLLGSLVITMAWRVWIFSSAEVENYQVVLPVLDSLGGTLFTFMLGFSLNFLPKNLSYKQRLSTLALGIASLLLLMQWQLFLNDQYWLGHWILVVWPPLTSLAIAAIIYSISDPSFAWRWLSSSCLIWLGHVSFGIYLWHFQVMRALVLIYPDFWDDSMTSLIALAIILPITLVLASLSFHFVEKPIMSWGKKVLSPQ